jgi:hypothetical protein
MTARAAEYILWRDGRTHAVKARCRANDGVDCVVIEPLPGRPVLVPLAVAQKAPQRSRPRLVVDNT